MLYVHTFKKKKKNGELLISSHSHTNNDVTPNLILKTEIGRRHGIVLYIQNVYNCLFVNEIPFLQASCLHSSYTMNTKSFAQTCSHFPAEKTMRQGFQVDERVEVLLAGSGQSPRMLVHQGEHSVSKMQTLEQFIDALIGWDASWKHSFFGSLNYL